MEIERVTLPEQAYIYVERTTQMGPQIADAMGSGFGEIYSFTEQKGIQRLAMPMAVYVDMPQDNQMTMRLGFFVSVADAEKAEGAVKSAVITAGDAVKAVHVGPYSSLNETHQAVWGHFATLGAKHAMPVWEIYVDDPTTMPEAEVKTQVFRKIG
ncbi:MAG: GyrI-like domain-containing protein [Pseudomonadota bacterium]